MKYEIQKYILLIKNQIQKCRLQTFSKVGLESVTLLN